MGSASSTVSETAPDAASRLEGLTQREAEERLRQVGPNDPSPRKRGALLIELLVLFLNPLVIILLIAVLISVVVGQVTDATIIFVIAMLSVVINFIQTYRSERSVQKIARTRQPHGLRPSRRKLAGSAARERCSGRSRAAFGR